MTSNVEKDLVEKLRSSTSSDVYSTLVNIRKNYIHNLDKMKTLEQYSVINLIIPLMEHPKFSNISLSIIADGCLELGFVNEVLKCDGPKALVRIMKSGVNDDILNRACRALGNIAKFAAGFKAVHLMKPISNIIKFLAETSDAHCQQTAVRTLMILGKSLKTRELIAQENGLVYIAKLLTSTNIQLVICSIKAIANLTYNCTVSSARPLVELGFHKVLVELHSHSDKAVRNHALISLKNLSSFEEIRTGLVKVGAVKLFTEVLSASDSNEMSRYAALALCRYLDHIHMWSHNGTDRSVGLKTLLAVLKNVHLQDIHISVLSSLIPLSFEFNVTEILLNLGVLWILTEMLDGFVKKYECKIAKNFSHGEQYQVNKCLVKSDNEKLSENNAPSNKNLERWENEYKYPVSPEQSHDDLHKSVYKWDNFLYSMGSPTSDYSGSCSPSGTCSPVQKYSECNYDNDVGSPATGHTSSGVWSPASIPNESCNENCWSPVVSYSSSPVREFEFTAYKESSNVMKDDFLLIENFSSTSLDMNIQGNQSKMSSGHNLSFDFDNEEEIKTVPKLSRTNSYNNLEAMTSSKKLKAIVLGVNDNTEELQYEMDDINSVNELKANMPSNSENIVNQSDDRSKESYSKILLDCSENAVMNKEEKIIDTCSNTTAGSSKSKYASTSDTDSNLVSDDTEQSSDFKVVNEKIDRHTLDRYIILFILQLSFHIKKKTNSYMAEKKFFAVLIDYLCLIHKPSLKVQTVLSNLIKNRYCLEKLIVNGFFCELEEKLNADERMLCPHHDHLLSSYSNLMYEGALEMESHYGIGTLSGILITSDKKGQLHAICTFSKLVTEKALLYKLLIDANGLSLLLEFLSDSDDKTKKRAVLSLFKIYKSLTEKKYEKVSVKCCFNRTCTMETSNKCFYKESFLNVTFVTRGGAKILANREKVCENSDYFNALLEGHFQESNSELVVLPDISAENLSLIFHFLHGCGNENACPYITRIPFSVLLEMLSDCDKYLLTNIKIFVEDRLCHRLFSSEIPKIYKQSRIHNSPALAKRALTEILRNTSRKSLVWNTYKELLEIGLSVNVYSDIEELLKSLLLPPL